MGMQSIELPSGSSIIRVQARNSLRAQFIARISTLHSGIQAPSPNSEVGT